MENLETAPPTHPIYRQNASLLVLIILCSGVFFLNLGGTHLWDRDEPRNAGCAQEMLNRGDWVVPIFNDQLRHQKPVFLYWLIISAYSVFGVNEFSARFWSALLGTGTVILTSLIGSRLFDRETGFWAGLILATTLMFTVASRAATPDAVLIFFFTASITAYVYFLYDADGRLRNASVFPRDGIFVFIFYGLLGLAVLAKGLAGFILPMAVIGMYMLLERLPSWDASRYSQLGLIPRIAIRIWRFAHPLHFLKTLFSMRPLIGALIVTACAAPWFIAVGIRTEGDFLRRFLFEEHVGRFSTVFENHSGGLWYYPVTLLVGFFPWSLFAWPVANDIGHKLKTSWHGPIVFLLCWVGVQVTLFSLAATKLPSYVTPCYPALALLAAYTLVRFQHGRSLGSPIWFQGSLVILVLVSILLAIAFVVLAERYLQGKWQIALVAAPLFVAAVWGLFYFRRSKRRAIQGFAWGAITFYVLFWGWGAVIVDSTRDIQRLLTDVRQLPDETRVASYRALESSWIFYGQRPIHELGVGKLSVDNAPLSLVRQRDWNPWPTLSPEQFAELDPHAVYLTTGRFQNELLARLPPGYQVLAQAPYFLKDEQVVLIGSAPRD